VSAVAPRVRPERDQSERAWWLRVVVVLISPTAVFAALRDDSDAASSARQEPVTALVLLGGIAGVLAAPATGRLMDDFAVDRLTALIVVFLSGGLYGAVVYWLAGGMLYVACERLGRSGTFRRSRHLLAYAVVPLVLSLPLVWPLAIAVYGRDVFESGGNDEGLGGHVFAALRLAFVAWSLVLLVVGVRTVHRWTWARSLAASALAVALTGGLLAVVTVLLRGA
jgi:hypothetical protein